jgi:hypothetical protein
MTKQSKERTAAGRPSGGGGQAKVLSPEEIARVEKCLAGTRTELRDRALCARVSPGIGPLWLRRASGSVPPSTVDRSAHGRSIRPHSPVVWGLLGADCWWALWAALSPSDRRLGLRIVLGTG